MAEKDERDSSPNITPPKQQELSSSRKLSLRTIVKFMAIALVAGVIAIAIVAAALSSHGPYCASLDITECTVSVQIRNDTGLVYEAKQCTGTGKTLCGSFGEVATLQPGESHATGGRTDKDPPQPWLIMGQDGKVAGCLNLQFTTNQAQAPPIIVPLSRLSSCNDWI